MEDRVWSLEFTVDDETSDMEGQISIVTALCKKIDLRYVEERGDDGDCCLLLPATTEGDLLDRLIIDATRQGCRVIAIIRDGQFPAIAATLGKMY